MGFGGLEAEALYEGANYVLWLIHLAVVAFIWHHFSWNDEFGGIFRVLSFAGAVGYTWKIIAPKSKESSNADSLASAKDFVSDLARAEPPEKGIFTLKCPDKIWRKIIRECLLRSKAVIIDLTESSSSLVWELNESVKTLGHKRILLACRCDDRSYPKIVPGELVKVLAPLDWRDFRLFCYPWHNNNGWADTHLLVRELRRLISDCIEGRPVTLEIARCEFCGHVIEHNEVEDVHCSKCGAVIPFRLRQS